MKSSAVRDILLAHAIDTAAPQEGVPTAVQRQSITQDCLHAVGSPQAAAGSGAQFQAFLQQRAQRIIQATRLPPELRQLWQHAPGIARWAPVALLLGALAFGFASHRIADPHRVNLLSLPLMGIVLWNLAVYLWVLVTGVKALVQRKRSPVPLLEPTSSGTDAAPAASHVPPLHWWQKLGARRLLRGSGMRKVGLTFERNWWHISQRLRHAQWLLWLHLAAALMAVGALASLWLTGLTNAYQVGWESTFLSAPQVQAWLNWLFWPVQQLGWVAPWQLTEVQALQGWVTNYTPNVNVNQMHNPSVGERWVLAYTWLLAVVVVVPRLLLALWQAVQAWWRAQHLALPLQQPYFQQLQRDFGGLATRLRVQPYSFDVTPERQQALERFASTQYGAGAQLQLLPTVAYGADLPANLADSTGQAQTVLLINLAATPEAEIHGAALEQLRNHAGTHASVWLWTHDFAARNTGAPRRVQEREQLWQDQIRATGLSPTLLPTDTSPSP